VDKSWEKGVGEGAGPKLPFWLEVVMESAEVAVVGGPPSILTTTARISVNTARASYGTCTRRHGWIFPPRVQDAVQRPYLQVLSRPQSSARSILVLCRI